MRQVLEQQGPYVFVMDAEELPGLESIRVYGSDFQLIYLGHEVILLESIELAWRYRGTPLATTDAWLRAVRPGETISLLTPEYLYEVGNAHMASKYARTDQHVPIKFPIDGDVRVTIHFRNQSGPTDSASFVLRGIPFDLRRDDSGPTLHLGYARSPAE